MPRIEASRRAPAHALASALDSRVAQLHLPPSFFKRLAKLFHCCPVKRDGSKKS
jgi:hypothetical protein